MTRIKTFLAERRLERILSWARDQSVSNDVWAKGLALWEEGHVKEIDLGSSMGRHFRVMRHSPDDIDLGPSSSRQVYVPDIGLPDCECPARVICKHIVAVGAYLTEEAIRV